VPQKPPFRIGRIRHGGAVETFSFVADSNKNFSIQASTADYINLLVRVFFIAMDDSVCESLV
jgi:hypothetical protein